MLDNAKNNLSQMDWTIYLTEDEIFSCLMKGTRRAGKTRLILQTVALSLVFLYSIIAYFMDETHPAMSLIIGIAALVIMGVMWIVPPFRFRHEARQIAEANHPIRIQVCEEGMIFGLEGETWFPFSQCEATIAENLLILNINSEIVGIPKRCMEEDQWVGLLQKFSDQL